MTALTTLAQGHLDKMHVRLQGQQVHYLLPLDEQRIELNSLLGRHISLDYQGVIHCTHCGRRSNKSFNQGYCFPCFRKLARCDNCIVSPEKCHYHLGTCREPEWADQFCMAEHVVYLANSSGVKVGITRATQLPTRWIDQGAVQALPIFTVQTRRQAGLLEDALRAHVSDRTQWQRMLKGEPEAVDLHGVRDQLMDQCDAQISQLQEQYGVQAVQPLSDQPVTTICYPVQCYPQKVTSFNLDKTQTVAGKLLGVKGQYLILDSGVINIRKFSAYAVQFSVTQ